MTYCLAIKTQDGLVLASDSRTSANFDDVRTHGKMQIYEFPGQSLFIVLSAGNLATTQAVHVAIQRDLDDAGSVASLRSMRHMFDAAEYVGRLNSRAQKLIADERAEPVTGLEASFIIGGQISGEEPSIYLVYALGNCIAASPETPFLQIGESKYGKPILDRIAGPHLGLEDAARGALLSLDSTMRSNISVAPPLDLVIYRRDELRVVTRMRFELDTPYFKTLRESWGGYLDRIIHSLPRFEWEISNPQPAMQPQIGIPHGSAGSYAPPEPAEAEVQTQQQQWGRTDSVGADEPGLP